MSRATNHGKRWTELDVDMLRDMIDGNTPTRIIALKMGRTARAVYAKAHRLGLSLKPTNQAPYGRAE